MFLRFSDQRVVTATPLLLSMEMIGAIRAEQENRVASQFELRASDHSRAAC